MTILVTGASGLVGFRLCGYLHRDGYEVVGLINESTRPELFAPDRPPMVKCDIRDAFAVSQIIRGYGVDTVVHLAACIPHASNADYIGVNVHGTANMLEASLECGVTKFVYASSMSVYSSPPEELPVSEGHPTMSDDLYGRTKMAGEVLCQCYKSLLCVPIVRFSSVFGPGDNSRVAYHFMQAAISGRNILVDGDGSQSSDFIYVDDAVQGVVLAMEKGKSGEVYNIGSGQETTVLQLAHSVAYLGGSDVVKLSGKPATRPFRFVADIRKARKELGYSPSDLVDGLREYKRGIKI